MNELLERMAEFVQSMFQRGSRYKVEKIAVVASYVVVMIASLIWAFSGNNPDNELGATFGRESLGQLEQQLFFVQNTSGKDWTRVRVVLDRKYLHTVDRVSSGGRLVLKPSDFDYFFYVPRPVGEHDWEELASGEKPKAEAPSTVVPRYLQIRAEQGRLDQELD